MRDCLRRSLTMIPLNCRFQGQNYTSSAVKAAQARDDLQVLAKLGQCGLRLHLGKDLKTGSAATPAAADKVL